MFLDLGSNDLEVLFFAGISDVVGEGLDEGVRFPDNMFSSSSDVMISSLHFPKELEAEIEVVLDLC